MKKLLTGKTGCGKTYRAVHEAKEHGQFAYIAPCRQLVYETALKYGGTGDSVSTGECKVNGQNNFFGVFESRIDLSRFNTLIVDEAHFIDDADRSLSILNKIDEANNLGLNIILMSATMPVRIEGFEVIELEPLQEFKLERVSPRDFWRRKEAGEPSIFFRARKDSCGEEGGYIINSDTSPASRLSTQLAFANGEINFIECTNVLAQGLNFPATNVLIEYNEWDSPALILQKIGRLGRPFIHKQDQTLTYAFVDRYGHDYGFVRSIEVSNEKQSVEQLKREAIENNSYEYERAKYRIEIASEAFCCDGNKILELLCKEGELPPAHTIFNIYDGVTRYDYKSFLKVHHLAQPEYWAVEDIESAMEWAQIYKRQEEEMQEFFLEIWNKKAA